jgi:hypothetical protein
MSEIEKYTGETLDTSGLPRDQLAKQDSMIEVEASAALLTEASTDEVTALSLDDMIPRSWRSWE